MSEKIAEQPSEVLFQPDGIQYMYEILVEDGGSSLQYSEKHDEHFGGPEYRHDGDYATATYALESVTNLRTGETLSENDADELENELVAWYGGFLNQGFEADRPHAFEVPAPNDDVTYRFEYERVGSKDPRR